MNVENLVERLVVEPGKQMSLQKDYDPAYTASGMDKTRGGDLLALGVRRLAEYQDKLYAQNSHALLVIFQAIDAAGKDGAIKHVMSGVNPQGCQVFSFKTPSQEELDHDYLWRCIRALPERGRIGIFNRSYYEEVVAVRVHPEFLARQQIPQELKNGKIWNRRFDEINSFEQYLTNNGIHVLKIFLHLSKEEQRQRFLKRLNRPEKNWKFSIADVKEREFWDAYMSAYESMLNNTSTKWAPWYVVPADRKWFSRLCVAAIICEKLKSLDLRYPEVNDDQKRQLESARKLLEAEADPRKHRNIKAARLRTAG
jgi:PPK2 family polyphosphate:nucleotide phosphotransferase